MARTNGYARWSVMERDNNNDTQNNISHSTDISFIIELFANLDYGRHAVADHHCSPQFLLIRELE